MAQETQVKSKKQVKQPPRPVAVLEPDVAGVPAVEPLLARQLSAAGGAAAPVDRHAAILRQALSAGRTGGARASRSMQNIQRQFGNRHLQQVMAQLQLQGAKPAVQRDEDDKKLGAAGPTTPQAPVVTPQPASPAAPSKPAAPAKSTAPSNGKTAAPAALPQTAAPGGNGPGPAQVAAPGSNGPDPTQSAPPAKGKGEAAPAADQAPASAAEDPGFQSVIGQTQQVAGEHKVHDPAEQKAQESQAAAEMPAEEKMGQAQSQQSAEIESAAASQEAQAADGSAPGFDKKAFISAVSAAIKRLTPSEPQKMENIGSSGVMDDVKQDVSGQVASGKEVAQGEVDDKVEQEPDAGAIPGKETTPLQANDPGPDPMGIDAAQAAPKPKGKSEIEAPLQAGSQSLDQQMAEADITEEQLASSNEPEFQEALGAKQESQTHAQAGPQEYRAAEQGTVTGAQGEAENLEQTQTQAMSDARRQSFGELDSLQTDAKGQDEGKRQEIGQAIDQIYQTTQSEVESILNELDTAVDSQFDDGANAAKSAAVGHIERETKTYKDERYNREGNLLEQGAGLFTRAGDWLTGMPDEYYQIYDRGRDKYLQEMNGVLDRVADTIADYLGRAKARIEQGRQEISNYVASQPEELQQVAQESAANIQSQFDQLEHQVNDKQTQLVDSLAQKYSENLQALDSQIASLKEKDKGLLARAQDAMGGVIQTILELKNMLADMLSRAAGAIDMIIQDPIGFLGNLIEGVKMGFMQFVSNIGAHLKAGLLEWLTGALGSAGITLPETFDLQGIFSLVLQILGLTYKNIRAQIVEALGSKGEQIVSALETAWDVLQIIRTEGLAGLWEYVKDKIGDLKTMVLEQIKDMVITQVIKAGVDWLIGVLGGPAGAFVKAVQGIIRVVTWFVENAGKVAALVNSVINSVTDIAAGNLSSAANFIENSLARALPMVISFLADLLGLGGIADKVKDIVGAVRAQVNKGIQWLIEQAKVVFQKIGKTLGFSKDEDEELDPERQQKVEAGLAQIDQEEARYTQSGNIKREDAEKVAATVKSAHPVFKSITVVDGDDTWDYAYVASPKKRKKGENKDDSKVQIELKRPSGFRSSTKKDLRDQYGDEHKKNVKSKDKLKKGFDRRHILSSKEMKDHYEGALNKCTTLKEAKALLETNKVGVKVKGKLSNKTLQAAAQKLYADAFNETENLWVGDSAENRLLQEKLDPLPGWSPQKAAGHVRKIKTKYFLAT